MVSKTYTIYLGKESSKEEFDIYDKAEKRYDALNYLYSLFHSWQKYGEKETVTKEEVEEWFREALFENGLDFLDVHHHGV